MACATLKRPLDWDPLNGTNDGPNYSPNGGPTVSPPSNVAMATINSPNHLNNNNNNGSNGNSNQRPAKRRCSRHVAMSCPIREPSPFKEVNSNKLLSENIVATIRDEMLRLYHRKQLHFHTQSGQQSGLQAGTSSMPHYASTSSPPECSSPVSLTQSMSLLSPTRKEQPLFTIRQVNLICERLAKERETQLRQEYDHILNTKLAEQYDTFVKFTFDQIQRRFETNSIPSYLS